MRLEKARQYIAQGYAFFIPDEVNFDSGKPYTACLLCGEVFQSILDRKVPAGHEPHNSAIARLAKTRRDEWAKKHAATHSESEHRQLRLSGRFATPEAAQALAPLGLFSIVDMVIDDEIEHALATAPRIPIKEVES